MSTIRKVAAVAVLTAAGLGLAALLTATPTEAAKGTCANVRCASCPDGQHLRLQWPNCCQCVPN